MPPHIPKSEVKKLFKLGGKKRQGWDCPSMPLQIKLNIEKINKTLKG